MTQLLQVIRIQAAEAADLEAPETQLADPDADQLQYPCRAPLQRQADDGQHVSRAFAIPSERMEKVFAAARTEGGYVDLVFRNPGFQELAPIRVRQVEMGFRPGRPAFDRIRIGDGVGHFLSDFITTHANVRADRGDQISRIDMKFVSNSCDRRFDNSRRGPAPTRVNGADRPRLGIRDQDGDTVRRLDAENRAPHGGNRGVALNRFSGRRGVVQIQNDSGMNLLQLQNRPTRRADRRQVSGAIHLHHGIRRIRRAERKIVPLAAARRKSVNDARNAIQRLGMNEGYLVLAFYL